ncbi:MAG TPA: hypothetical protein VK427_05880, partial [Kofleriaceae bacterium]|nr:hypothetical protein [Kofleriaceae bacterium]
MPPKGARSTSEKKPTAKKPAAPRKPRKVKPAAGSIGLTAEEVASGSPTPDVARLRKQIEDAG